MRMDNLESWVITATGGLVVLLAELLLMEQRVLQGVLLYSVMLILLLLYGTFRWPRPQHHLLVLTIPAVIRLMAYTLPLGELSPIFAQLMISIPVGLTAVIFVWLLEQEWPSLRFQWQQTPYYLLMIVMGGSMGLLLYQFHQPAPPVWTNPLLMLFYAFVLLLMAFLEEWLFRGIMQTALTKLWHTGFWAGLTVAFFYTTMNLNQGTGLFILSIFVFSLILGRLQHMSDSLLNVFLLHGMLNLTFFLILPAIGNIT